MDYRIFNVRTDVNACDCTRGCTDTERESALKVESRRKISCRTGESDLCRWRAGPMLCQLSFVPTPFTSVRKMQSRQRTKSSLARMGAVILASPLSHHNWPRLFPTTIGLVSFPPQLAWPLSHHNWPGLFPTTTGLVSFPLQQASSLSYHIISVSLPRGESGPVRTLPGGLIRSEELKLTPG